MEISRKRTTLGKTESNSVRLFHAIAVLMTLAGAGGSLGFTLYTGQNSESVILTLLFSGWVVSPFIALLLINAVSKRWWILTKLAIYSLMVVITLGSLVIYSGIWIPPNAKSAFIFLIIPLLSWTLVGIVLMAAKLAPSR